MKTQCPYKKGKYTCEHGEECTKDSQQTQSEMPSEWNECPVAQRQLNGNPWRNEKPVILKNRHCDTCGKVVDECERVRPSFKGRPCTFWVPKEQVKPQYVVSDWNGECKVFASKGDLELWLSQQWRLHRH